MWKILTKHVRWPIVPMLIVSPIMILGLITMSSIGDAHTVFYKQLIWIVISLFAMFVSVNINYAIMSRSLASVIIYTLSCVLLLMLFVIGKVTNGAQSWLHIGMISFQPADLMKLALIMLLAKYFSKRHVEIANIKHLAISGLYLGLPFLFVLLQPDLGSAIILLVIWFGMILISGAARIHIIYLFFIALVTVALSWVFLFKPYQKDRIINFIHPLHDVRGSGYNAYQSTIAVGNGGLYGQGIGYGSQSRLNYLPEHETDFIFAAFAEEWGYVGATCLLVLYLALLFYLTFGVYNMQDNYASLFISGYIIWLYTHIIINIGMNLGVSPVTGIPLPFMSYGGSHLLLESIALGICASMIYNNR